MFSASLLLSALLPLGSLFGFPSEPEDTRCVTVPPICEPGQHPYCVCPSDISLDCHWVCASIDTEHNTFRKSFQRSYEEAEKQVEYPHMAE